MTLLDTDIFTHLTSPSIFAYKSGSQVTILLFDVHWLRLLLDREAG